jgi:DnaK suppressor protein
MEPEKVEMFRKLLNQQLTALLSEAGGTLGDLTDANKEVHADPIDIASTESNRDFQLRIRDRERFLIRKIKEAIQRIDDGEYGYCVGCGNEISEKRLVARPVATHCIDCKTEAEQIERRSRTF